MAKVGAEDDMFWFIVILSPRMGLAWNVPSSSLSRLRV